MSSDAIFGREPELAALTDFFASGMDEPLALLISGEAGIGKTTLWRAGIRLADRDGVVLSARAGESETTLSFATLGDLFDPVVDDVFANLPVPQRRALEVALLRRESKGSSPDRRAIGVAVHAVVQLLARHDPLTIAIDDVQWVDPSSAAALGYAFRRLRSGRIRVLAALREAKGVSDELDLGQVFPSLRRLAVAPISIRALPMLLRDRVDANISDSVGRRIHTMSRGNPFFAVEIARAAKGTLLTDAGEPLQVPESLHDVVRGRLDELSVEARDALLIASLLSRPTRASVEAAGGSREGIQEAQAAGALEEHGDSLEFAHPLLASTISSSASRQVRREIHGSLAEIASDNEERARHLALSIDRPDANVADVLERAALGARERGAPEAAADLYELSVKATPLSDPEAIRLRALEAAGNHFDAGDTSVARAIGERTLTTSAPGRPRAHTLFMLSILCWNDIGRVDALLTQALAEVGDDIDSRARILADLGWVSVHQTDLARAAERAREALKLAERLGDPFVLRLSLSVLGTAEFLMGRPVHDIMARALSFSGSLVHAESSSATICLGRQQMWADDVEAARSTLTAELARYREQGHEAQCWEILNDLARVECRAGRTFIASEYEREANDIAVEAGLEDVRSQLLHVQAQVQAIVGLIEEARASASEGLRISLAFGDQWHEIENRTVLGFVEISAGNARQAHEHMAPLSRLTESMGVEEPGLFPFVPDEVEALVALGELDQAKALSERLESQGRALKRRLALATAARCRGIIAAALGDLPGAADELGAALRHHDGLTQPLELGRTLLVTGGVQRRLKKKAPARETLTRALRVFESVEAPLWTARTKRELERIGGRAPSPTELTPTERQIARLVAEGHTNREVADVMFISVHTVAANLKRIYRKVGVRSRTELAARMKS